MRRSNKRILVEINDDFLPQINRRKVEFFRMLMDATNKKEKATELATRFGTVLINTGDGHEKLVVNVDGETVFRR